MPVCHRSTTTECQILLIKMSFQAWHTRQGAVASFLSKYSATCENTSEMRGRLDIMNVGRGVGDGAMKMVVEIY